MHQIEMTPELEAYVQAALATGQYHSLDDLIAEALHWHREQSALKDQLRRDLQVGLDQLDEGHARNIATPEEHSQFRSEIRQRIQRGDNQVSYKE